MSGIDPRAVVSPKAELASDVLPLKYGMPPEVPLAAIARVPVVVTGEPDTVKMPGTLRATEVTLPLPAGAAQVPSARR